MMPSDREILDELLNSININKYDTREYEARFDQNGRLIYLDLSNKSLTSIPVAIAQFINLRELHLTGNCLGEFPSGVCQLTNLRGLYLVGNQIEVLPPTIGNLINLSVLGLSHNRLKNLPSEIGLLINLTSLYIYSNQLKELPYEIGNLTELPQLILKDNALTKLPSSISRLQRLVALDLRNNKISELPIEISQLTNLVKLSVDNNHLRSISSEIALLPSLREFTLTSNPLEQPPIEVVKQGFESVQKYFQQLQEQGKAYLYEAKLLIVGESGAGKTTLAKKIQNSAYQLQEENSTEGIDVIQWKFLMSKDKIFRVNIWDFGGQEIYHATHQFFLTKRALYILVADTRKEDTDFYYWLNIVELLSGNSPLIIVKNEKQDRQRQINERALRGQFTNLEKTLATNLLTNRGLPELINHVIHHICNLPHVGTSLPMQWIKVREILEQDPRNHITIEEFYDICNRYGFEQFADKKQLSSYFHDLGVFLHFQDDALLRKTVILKPEWGTDAVYKILDNKKVINNLGKFNRMDLEQIWSENQYIYMQDELLQLMMKFGLCYKIPGKYDSYIAPQLLTENQPEYDWDQTEELKLRYTYEFMPKGIITQFIVAMHSYIVEQELVWKSGIIIEKDQTRALVIENYGNREIEINVIGKQKRDFLRTIVDKLDEIHDSFNKRLIVAKLIPCNCKQCKSSKQPYFYPYNILRKFLADGQFIIQCQTSYEMISVQRLVDDTFGDSRLSQPESVINVDTKLSIPSSKHQISSMSEVKVEDKTSKIKILFLTANPSDTSRLRLDQESRAIDRALRRADFRDRFEFEQFQAVQISDFQECLLRFKPHILHFSGHATDEGELVLEDGRGNSQPISERALSTLLHTLKDNIHCVILNSCFSERQAKMITENIDYVICMSQAVSDESAISFSAAFYQALAYGRDITTAFSLGCNQVDLENSDESNIPILISNKNTPQNIRFVP